MAVKNPTLNVIKPCLKCGQKFLPKGETKNRIAKYCSKACWSTRKHGPRQCLNCSKPIKNPNKYCGIECRNTSYIGRKASEETLKKMSESKKGYMPVNVFQSGKAHPNYKKDRSQVNPRWSSEYNAWRKMVFQKCGDKCVKCTRDDGVLLDADHIKPFATNQNYRFDVNNGRVLCRPCHRKEPTWGMKSKNQKKFTGKQAVLADG